MHLLVLLAYSLRLFSALLLVLQITNSRSTAGLSLKTQLLYTLTFLLRTLSPFNTINSLVLSLISCILLAITAWTAYLIAYKHPFRLTYDAHNDQFSGTLCLAIAAVFAWLFGGLSCWLQAVAILPQLYMIRRQGDIQNITRLYMVFLGLSSGMSLSDGVMQQGWNKLWCKLVESILYLDFFYYYVVSWREQDKFRFPL